jgi:hypothetical protein
MWLYVGPRTANYYNEQRLSAEMTTWKEHFEQHLNDGTEKDQLTINYLSADIFDIRFAGSTSRNRRVAKIFEE